MKRIIGVGSPFGADRLGWLAIDHLEKCLLPDCELVRLDRPGPGLLEYFKGAEQVVLIDAVLSRAEAGEAVTVSVDELADCGCLTSSHGFGVAEAVVLAGQLGALPSRLHLIGIHAGSDPSSPPRLNTTLLERRIQDLL